MRPENQIRSHLEAIRTIMRVPRTCQGLEMVVCEAAKQQMKLEIATLEWALGSCSHDGRIEEIAAMATKARKT